MKDLRNEIQEDKRKLINEWFLKGQNSIKRKNVSGCVCVINDNDEIERVCGLHEEWHESLLQIPLEVREANQEVNQFALDIAKACMEIKSSHVYFILQQAFDKKGFMSWEEMEEKLSRIIKQSRHKK